MKKLRLTFFSYFESVKQAGQTIAAHKFRSVLTVLGVIVGTTTVILVSSIITGMNARFSEMVERFGTNIVFISKWSNNGGGGGGRSKEEEQRKPITIEDNEAIKQLASVVDSTATLSVWPGNSNAAVIKYRDKEANRPALRGGQGNFFAVRNMTLSKGRVFTQVEDDRAVPVVVLGYDLADALFSGIEPIEKEITINGQLFRVIGTLEKSPGRGLFGNNNWEDGAAIIPLGTFQKMYPQVEDTVICAKAKPGQMDTMFDQITDLLRRRRQVAYSEPDNFGISNAKQDMESFSKVTDMMLMFVVPISGMGLLVGGIGVMNIMLVSVTERTKEIGVRRALGAKRRDIVLQFLIEAMSLTGLGGLIGIGLGLLLSWIVNVALPDLPSAIPMWSIIIGFSVSVGIGLVSGLWPAVKAAWLDPVEALRYE